MTRLHMLGVLASTAPTEGAVAGGEDATPALAAPVLGVDPDWRERIELAKRAYQDGKKLREGKPITFRVDHPLPAIIRQTHCHPPPPDSERSSHTSR